MKKTMLLACFACLFLCQSALAQQPEIYSRVKVFANQQQAVKLLQQGVTLDELGERKPNYLVGEFSAADIKLMKAQKLRIQYLVTDLAADFKTKNALVRREAQSAAAAAAVPAGFNYGSMGGYLTFAEMELELDSLRAMYPNLITSKISMGNSLEGRPIWVVKISDNADVDENEPEVFLNGLIHAREAVSMSNLIYFMQYILQNYQTDAELNCLINSREIYVAACLNPDGYVYNQTTNPAGGGGWRKNRRNNGNGTFGVDLNRNFGFKWGLDNTGSSPNGSSDSYRGMAAFSEPETQAVRNFCTAHQFGNVVNHHSYANTFNTPWGYVNQATPDNAHYQNWGALATMVNGIQVGTSYQNLGYLLNGGANDWMYGEQTTKNKIFAAVVETGSSSDGFWPLQNRIIPLNEQNLHLNISTCWVAGDYFKPSIPAGATGGGTSFILPVSVQNLGLQAGTVEAVSFSTSDVRVAGTGPAISLSGLAVDGLLNGSLNIQMAANAAAGIITGTLSATTVSGCVLSFPASFNYLGNCNVLPTGFTNGDVGGVTIAGSVCYVSPDYTVRGSGTGLQSTSDQYHFVKRTVSGNHTIVARLASITNTSANAKAGIVFSENTAAGAKRVSLCIIPSSGKLEFQFRKMAGGKVTTTSTFSATAPRWLKITRSGNNFSAYHSVNGTTWTLYTTATVSMSSAALAGLATTSGINTATSTALFDNVAVTAGVAARSSEPIFVEADDANKLTVYPNPTEGKYARLQVTWPASENALVNISDMSGNIIFQKTIIMQRGNNNIALNEISRLQAGTYIVSVTAKSQLRKTKLVIAKQ
ncbi:MAG: M14 family zinc carboxypeptidase [Bacteroidota bacterium]